ncbi:MAG TPA: DNA primase [Flavobacterium sp.]|nr:DNA primase [Flavobacterium sp.]
MISKNTIDTVFEVARVEEVIGEFVQLKRAGSNLKGLSPFADEKSPSFMVSPSKQIWKDFSSGKGGNAISFLMEHEHFSYPEAIRYLAKKYNIEIEETEQSAEEKEQASEKESMYLVSEFAKEYFHKILLTTEEGKAIGLSYFKERGFTPETIKNFSLGYSPDHWTAFTDEALKSGYSLDFLDKAGLTIVKEDKKFDRFKGRVMFPIQSMSGRVLGFGGRILGTDKKAAKYLNSPESEIYHKSKILYGIFQAKQAIAKQDNCYLVEGYTDVIQFNQSGVENVVASSGTALSADQIRLISRLTKNITVLFDGDAAGLRASIRGIDLILEEGMNVRVCSFPTGEDPDSFARKTSFEELSLYLEENAKDFIQFKASLLVEDTKNDPVKKAELIRDMVNSISKIPDRIKREVYIKETSRIMDISENVLANTLAQILRKESFDSTKKNIEQTRNLEAVKREETQLQKIDFLEVIEENILKILLNFPTKELTFEDYLYVLNAEGEQEQKVIQKNYKVYERIYLSLQDDEIEFTNQSFKEIYNHLITHLNAVGNFDKEKYIASIPQELAGKISDLYFSEDKYRLDNWESKSIFPRTKEQDDVIVQNIEGTVLNLRCHLIYKLIGEMMDQTKNMDSQTDNSELLTEVTQYHQLRKFLFSKLGNVTPLNHYSQYGK